MSIFKCKMCGADLTIKENQKIVTCDFCGSTQTLPSSDDEKKIALFNRANSLRFRNEFDKAMFTYQSIIAEFNNEAEAYWGVCLSKYGIEYVDDPYTGDKVPTCHRTLYESILNDEDYLSALKYADELTKKLYEKEAIEIDKIQKRIIKLAQKEENYDIFISYKESDSNNERTKDSVIGEEIYDKLSENGYRVFFSKISLENKLGHEYEPIIFNALRTAKVMLVIGSKDEYFNAPWVKNEWSRYIHFMENDKNKYLIPCFFDMNAYDMPEELLAFQAQDLSKLGAIQDILRGIQKLIGEGKNIIEIVNKENQDNKAVVSTFSIENSIKNCITRIEQALNSSNFEKADWILDELFAYDENNYKAYLFKVLIDKRCKNVDELINKKINLTNNKDFINAINNCNDEKEKEKLNNVLSSSSQFEINNNDLTNNFNETLLNSSPLNEDKNYEIYKKVIDLILDNKKEEAVEILKTVPKFNDATRLMNDSTYFGEVYSYIRITLLVKENNVTSLLYFLPTASNKFFNINDEGDKEILEFIYSLGKLYQKNINENTINNRYARRIFLFLNNYKDSYSIYESLPNLDEDEEIYLNAIKKLIKGYMEDALNLLRKIEEYKDSAKIITNTFYFHNLLTFLAPLKDVYYKDFKSLIKDLKKVDFNQFQYLFKALNYLSYLHEGVTYYKNKKDDEKAAKLTKIIADLNKKVNG